MNLPATDESDVHEQGTRQKRDQTCDTTLAKRKSLLMQDPRYVA